MLHFFFCFLDNLYQISQPCLRRIVDNELIMGQAVTASGRPLAKGIGQPTLPCRRVWVSAFYDRADWDFDAVWKHEGSGVIWSTASYPESTFVGMCQLPLGGRLTCWSSAEPSSKCSETSTETKSSTCPYHWTRP